MFNGAEMKIVLKSDFNKGENEVMGKLCEHYEKVQKACHFNKEVTNFLCHFIPFYSSSIFTHEELFALLKFTSRIDWSIEKMTKKAIIGIIIRLLLILFHVASEHAIKV